MNMRQSLVVVACGGVTLLAIGYAVGQVSSSAPAIPASQPHALTRVAVVDLVKVFGEYDAVRDLNTLLKRQREDLATEAGTRRKALEEAEIKLRAYRPDSPDYAAVRRDYRKQAMEFDTWMRVTEEEVKTEECQWMARLYDQSCDVVRRLAESRQIDVVVTSESFNPIVAQDNMDALQSQIRGRKVVYSKSGVDITRDVLSELNREYRARGGKNSLKL